jgi:hypothetical protein
MTAALLERTWKDANTAVDNPAGEGFGELSLEDLRQDRTAYNSSGWVCSLTQDCGTIVCSC